MTFSKKLLSVSLALLMSLSLMSGVILFESSAAVIETPLPGFTEFSQEEIDLMWRTSEAYIGGQYVYDPDGATATKAGDDGVALTMGDMIAVLRLGTAKFTQETINGTVTKFQDGKRELINGKSIFGDVDISNKRTLRFKIDGGYTGKVKIAFQGKTTTGIYATWGNDHFCHDSSEVSVGADGYMTINLRNTRRDWQNSSKAETEWKNLVDQISIIQIVLLNATTGKEYTFSDWYVTAYTDTDDLKAALHRIEEFGVENTELTEEYIEAAWALYKNADNQDQSLVDGYTEAINDAVDAVEAEFVAAKAKLNDLLNEADMLGFFEPSSIWYDTVTGCDLVYANPDSGLSDFKAAIKNVRTAIFSETMGTDLYELLVGFDGLWRYNYTDDSYTALEDAVAAAWNEYNGDNEDELLATVQAKYADLKAVKTYQVVDFGIDGWTTDSVNEVVDANSDKLCDSIGDGLNRDQVWNNGDFSNNTVFEVVDGAFEMTATADFTGKSIGWKNLDRAGTLAGIALGAYPTLNVTGLSGADGIRLKIGVSESGSAERILIGLSNCKDFVREMYALNINPEGVDADGYINIPFSYFQKAFWCPAFAQGELDSVICLIIEAYGVTEGTTISFSDLTGYSYTKPFVEATQEQIDALNAAVADLEEISLGDDYFANLLALADDALESNDGDVITEATAEVISMLDSYIPTGSTSAIDRSAAKAKLIELIGMDTTEYYKTEIAAMKASYYDTELTTDGVTAIVDECDTYIKKLTPPEAPAAPVLLSATTDTVTLVAGAKSIEFRCNDGAWVSTNIFTDLEPNTTYTFYMRIRGFAPTPASAPSSGLEVTTKKLAFSGDASISGTLAFGETISAEAENLPENCGELTYEWYRLLNLGAELVGTESSYTLVKEDIGCTFGVKVFAANYEGSIESDESAIVEKGTPEIITEPSSVVIFIGDTIGSAAITGAETDVEGSWEWETPDMIPELSQSGSTFAAVFTPADTDAYKTVKVYIVVTISSNTEAMVITDEESGLSLAGDFVIGATPSLTVEDITPSSIAYLNLLRAARRSESENNLILFKTMKIEGGAYIGQLTLTARVSLSRAGKTYTVWYFADGEVQSAEAVVDSDGNITIPGIII